MENRRIYRSQDEAPKACPVEGCTFKLGGGKVGVGGSCNGAREIRHCDTVGLSETTYNVRKQQGCLDISSMDRSLDWVKQGRPTS